MYTRTLRTTGETLTVARPQEIGADTTEGKWVTFCEDHKTLVYSATEKLAYATTGTDFCDDCRTRAAQPKAPKEQAPKVNFGIRTQAFAYSEGLKDAMDLLVTALEEGGHVNYLLEVLEANARPATVDRLNAFYTPGHTEAPEAAPLATVREFSNEKDAKAFAKAQGGPVNVHIERIKRGLWMVDVSSK